jgi:hypothetical protein
MNEGGRRIMSRMGWEQQGSRMRIVEEDEIQSNER